MRLRKTYQAPEVVHMLRALIERSLEWATGLCIFDGDIQKTYDHVKHHKLTVALRNCAICATSGARRPLPSSPPSDA